LHRGVVQHAAVLEYGKRIPGKWRFRKNVDDPEWTGGHRRQLLQFGGASAASRAGTIPVHANGDVWTLTANVPRHRSPSASREALAHMLGLAVADVAANVQPLWVDTGSEQLIIPLASFDAVRRAQPVAAELLHHGSNGERAMAYVFARERNRVLARFFFPKHGAVIEDPGTGSACANLGGWLLAMNEPLPVELVIDQGEAVGRRCRLGLRVDDDRSIHVSGRVIEIGRGTITL